MDQQGGAMERKPASKARVKVAIRVRPMLAREMVGDYRPCIQIRAKSQIVIGTDRQLMSDKNNSREYKYDHVFGEESPQQDVYVQCIRQLVLSCFEGYNAAVLAYGQTGSGKTYTMGTAVSTLADQERIGIIPRVINEIFEQVEERRPQATITVTASYIELYNEQIVDLLTDSQLKLKNDAIAIKEDKENGLVNVEGVIKECVTTPEQLLRLLERGGMHRTTKHTNMNDTSSRSHAIFTIYIDSQPIRSEKESKEKEEQLSGITHSRFFFADLAGSQRAKKTGATGDTLKEGININLGLLQLGNVISALSTIQRNKDQFITFRNSKLTRILQDALGGNSNTYMIACVSPAESNYQQSLNTLKYASKAMNIKNTPVINRNKHDMLRQENQELRGENRRLKQLLAEKGVRIELEEDQPVDLVVMQAKILKDENRMLNRRYNQALVELQKTKHRLNELQIKIYDIRREKDIMQLKFEELVKEHPLLGEGEIGAALRQKFEENEREQVSVVEKYLQSIQVLETKLGDKENLYGQLQTEYNSLLENSRKDEQILIKKHNLLYAIGKENNKLRQEMARLMQEQGREGEGHESGEVGEEVEAMMLEQGEELQQDEVIQVEQSDYVKREQETKEQLSEVDRYILQKQQFLQRISKDQISLESELISSMKNQYHQKIELLEKEKKQLLKLRDETGTVEKHKSNNKIENLQNELKEYRKKAREQGNLQKQVENKNSKIRTLSDEISKFKMQRMELNRKLKEDKDNFEKLKNRRIKELLVARKENLKKENDIRKEKMKNFKYEQNAKKKDEEIKRIKRVNEALKNIVKPTRSAHLPKRDSLAPVSAVQEVPEGRQLERQQEEFVIRMTKQYLCEIEREQGLNELQRRLAKAEEELMLLLNDDAANKIKLQRIQLKEPEELTEEDVAERAGLELVVRSYEEDIRNYQTYIADLQQSPEHTAPVYFFDIQSAVIYSKSYDSIDAMRSFVRALNQAFKNLLYENCQLLGQHRRDEAEVQELRAEIFEQREKIMGLNAQMQRILAQAREEMMMNRYYTAQEPEVVSVGLKRLDEREKKEMERKVQDLAKNNRQLASELEKTRRKCEIVQEKYQSIKNLVSKDKNIGRQEEPSFSKPEKKMEKQASNRQLIDELDGMIENMDRIDRLKKTKSYTAFEEQSNGQTQPIVEGEGEGSSNRWQCIWKEAAHSSGVLSIAAHSNYVISTATKSIKIWDLQCRKMLAELPAPAAVKYVMIDPDRRLFFTACEKQVTIWDLISLQVQGVLKCHRDEVRAIHTYGDYVFTGGKGSPNGGSLLVWDLRKLNPNQALEQKQKSQDIFTLTSNQNVLYYGTRNHSVRRMAIGSWDVLSPFEPPHLDSVTGLAVVGGRLVSGSKDKHLRLWALDHAVNNSRHTFHAFNDYVTTVQGVPNAPLFYAGSKDGQLKACYVKNDRIEVLGNFLAHTQSVNAVCSLEDNPLAVITASQDKMIKIWHPSKETLENVARERYFE